jgi:hypothetical protein
MATLGMTLSAGEQSDPPENTPTDQNGGNTSQAVQSGNATDPTLPVYSTTKLSQPLDLELENSLRWQKNVLNVAVIFHEKGEIAFLLNRQELLSITDKQ